MKMCYNGSFCLSLKYPLCFMEAQSSGLDLSLHSAMYRELNLIRTPQVATKLMTQENKNFILSHSVYLYFILGLYDKKMFFDY